MIAGCRTGRGRDPRGSRARTAAADPSGRGQFSIARHTAGGLVLLLGQTRTPVRLPWRALEQIPDLRRGRGWVLIGSTYATTGTPRSLDQHLKTFTPNRHRRMDRRGAGTGRHRHHRPQPPGTRPPEPGRAGPGELS